MDSACHLCGTPYHRIKSNQRYCSRECYKRAWFALNPEKNAAKNLARRKRKPEWYLARERGYSEAYRRRIAIRTAWKRLLRSARIRAKEKRIQFELTEEWARRRWTGRCEITGVEFSSLAENIGRSAFGPKPYSPSIDRIDAAKGYIESNARFVLWGCNAIKGAGTDADMYAIAEAIVRSKPP